MKKVFSIFMIFLAVFLVSCGAVTDGTGPKNTVRITMPGARSVSAGGAEDVDYYNIQIARQSFSNVRAGDTVESAPIAVGTRVSISVEAIGKITASSSVSQSGGAVGATTKTVVSNGRVAYYQTTQTLPAGGLTLNINMANYKTEYHKVTLEAGDFDRVPEEVYVADGSSYTLPNYGTYTPFTGANSGVPLKHTGWIWRIPGNDTPPVYPVGASVTITGDRQFELQYDTYATITFVTQNFGQQIPQEYCEKNTYYTLKNYGINDSSTGPNKHTGWSYTDSTGNQQVGLTARVFITDDTQFTLDYIEGVQIYIENINSVDLAGNDSIYYSETSMSPYFIWEGQPVILPSGKRNDGQDVEEWEYLDTNSNTVKKNPGDRLEYDSKWEIGGCSLRISAVLP